MGEIFMSYYWVLKLQNNVLCENIFIKWESRMKGLYQKVNSENINDFNN